MKRFQIDQDRFCKSMKIKYIFCIFLLMTVAILYGAPPVLAGPAPIETLSDSLPAERDQSSLKKAAPDTAKFKASYLKLPLLFESNLGQTDPQVRFLSRGSGYTLFLTDAEAVLALRGKRQKKENEGQPDSESNQRTTNNKQPAVLRMKLLGGNPGDAVEGLQQTSGKSNYFIGNDPRKWYTNVPNYRKVEYREVYSGIDLVYYGNQRRLEYDFMVAPGADPDLIRLQFEGAQGIHIDENGDLVLTLSGEGSQIRFRAPFTFQENGTGRQTVASRYVIKEGNEVGFEIAAYDTTRTLVIDPVLDYASYLGDSDVDEGRHIAVDASGNAYVTGYTKSTNFPTTGGAYDTSHNSVGFEDIFVTKFNAAGSGLVYSTFIGGGDNDKGYAIALDTSGNAYIVGTTKSSNFPTVNAYDTSLGGTNDAIVAKLSSDGASLLYSTYYGGSASDGASSAAMALDSGGNVYFTGQTGSGDLPLANAYDNGLTGPVDVYVAKINTNTSGAAGLQYSSYLGGTDQAWYELAGDISFDGSGNIYVIGMTSAINFPTTGTSYQPARVDPGTNHDGFLVKLDPTVSGAGGLLYGTYFGGNQRDVMAGLIVDGAGVAYMSGNTQSTNFPTTAGAYDTSFNSGNDAFIAKLNPAGTGANDLIYGTYLGGIGNDYANDIAIDADGRIYLAGTTGSSADFPLVNPVQGGFGGGSSDAYVGILNPAGAGAADLEFSTFLGGNADDSGWGVALDSLGDIYTCGATDAADFPATAGAYDQSYNLNTDVFVAKYKMGSRPTISSAANQTFTVGDPATAISTITVTDDDTVASITAANDIRIRIPAGFNMVWNASDTTATIAGGASGKVSTSVTYEDSDKTLVIDVTTDFAVSNQISVSGLSFKNFTAPSTSDNLELEVDNGGTVAAIDDKTITIQGNTAMAVWAESGATIPEYNLWDGTSFGTEDVSANVGEWRTMAGAESPTAGQLGEVIVVGVDSGGAINGEMWNGSTWSALSINQLNATAVSETYWWAMDVAYEQDSGDAVVVWNNNTASHMLQYSVWNGASWSAKTTISAYTGGEPQTMHLAAKPGADEMVLVVNDVNADDYALVWDGSAWGNQLSLDTSGTTESDQSAFYVAYEQGTGRAVVVYGKDADPDCYYRIWNGSAWVPGEGTITAPVGVTSQVAWVRLASDPNSNRIALGVVTTGGTAADIWLNVWDGSSWETSQPAETTATGSIFPGVAVAFESSTGEALAAYGENGQSLVRYRTWSSGSGWSAEQTDGPDVGAGETPNTLLLESDPLSDDIMLAVQDDPGQNLNYVLWNGAFWGTPSEQEVDTGETKNQPFIFLWDQVQSDKPTISSDADQEFMVDSPAAAISTITVTDNSGTPTITAANDIRIRIPAGFNMIWDTSDTTATIGGGASGKVSASVSYEDSGKTLVIDVITDFAAADQITIADLSFTSFTAPSSADNLELEVYNDDAVSAYDDKSITINSPMKLATGSYTGNGTAGTAITGLGFQPDVVIIKAADDTQEAVCHTSSMSGDLSKPMGGAAALAMYLIQSLDTDGFTIGNDDRVNQSGITYHWIAFQAGAGEMTVNSYTGTGVDGTSVSGVGFQPDYVIVMSALARVPVHRSSAQVGDTTLFFNDTASAADHIQALEADGFQVGGDARVNTLDETYHYIAWKAVVGKMAVGLHPGNDIDDTDVSGVGFEPEYVIIKQDNNKEAVQRPDSLAGDDTLWFVPSISASNQIQELQSDGFQVGDDDNVNKNGETYFWMAFAGSHLTITSVADQTFTVGDPLTAISTITITDGIDTPLITAADDIRIRIPAGFNMSWDTADLTAVIGGAAAANVATAVTYEDSGMTLVLDVTADFVAGDQITVSGLGFTGFAATSAPDNLELEVENDGTVAAYDKKTIRIVGPLSISSAIDQQFTVDDPATVAATIAITDDSATPQITSGNELRIRIPTGFNMTWDSSVTTVAIGGSAAAKVSTTVKAYEDGDRTLVLDVTSNFAAAEYITLAGAQFTDFSAVSAADNLELDVNADATGDALDDKTVTIIEEPSISSAVDQVFEVGDPVTAIAVITVADVTAGAPMITAASDIRIRIPAGFSMTWHTADTTAVIGGGAAGKVSDTVSYEDGGQTLVLDVDADFAAGDQITVSGLSFTNFAAASQVDQLELEVNDDDVVTDLDDKTIKILDPADGDKDINPVENLELIPAGSLVIAMDNDKQIADGSAFNLNAYGLANSLLWDEIPVKWAIDTGKAKDGIDFSAEAQRIYPSTLAAATLDFRGGPFIIHEYWAAEAQPKIAAFGNDVAVYRLTEDVTVDIRYTLTHKPKVGVLSDGGNAAIHTAVLAAAGFVADTHYETILAASLLTVNADSCFTFVSEPHWGEDDPGSDPQAEAIRSFVESSGNFLAQCEAVLSYENNTTYGLFQTTNGYVNNDLGNANVIYASPDISYSQIHGDLDAAQGGSLEDFTFAVGSSFHNNGHIHVHNTPETDRYVATASKLTVGIGSNVYYLGGHQYAGDSLEQLNGRRMYLNAVLTPSGRPTDCALNFPADMIQPSISSAINQFFIQGEPPVAISTITITDDEDTPTITTAGDIRIRIPAGFNMTWDTSDASAVIGGAASGKVSGDVTYEDSGQTLVIDVTSDFAASDQITIAGLSFMNFSGPSPADNLELEVADDGTPIATDDKTISIGPPEISSAANQTFAVGDPPTAISTITITEAATGTSMTAAKEIRIRIPDGLNMTWDTSDTTAVLGGSAAARVSATVSYEDGGKTLVLDVLTDFAPSDVLTISDLSFANFIAVSAPDNLGLEVRNDGYLQATDDKTITIADINITSAADQIFAVNDPATGISPITVTDDSNSPLITATNDIRIRIPAGFNMTWDTSDTAVDVSGPAAAKVSGTVSYEDGDKTLVLDVTSDFAAWDQITVSGLSFTSFTAASAADNLELEVHNDGTTVATDDQTKAVGAPTISSAADQIFYEADPPTAVSTITVTDDGSTPTITAGSDIRIRIPAGFTMTWDTTETTAVIGGAAAGKVSTTVTYEDGDQTLVLDVTADFSAGDQITVSGLSFTGFGTSADDNLELEVSNADTVAAVDDKTIIVNSRMKIRTGYYTGNGLDDTPITGLGFEPDVVIVKVADNTKEGVMRTSSMAGDLSKPMGGATALEADLIQSLDADGFTIGMDDRVNQDTFTYHWIAFEAGDGEMKVDSYTGTGADNTSVSGVGFQPDYVMVLPAINQEPVHRSSAQIGDTTLFFKNSAAATNHIQALEADGFQVGDDDRVNKLDQTYHYIAWKEVAGKMAVGTYDGNATDGTEISGLGFAPEYVIVKQNDNVEAVHRPDSLGGDNTLWFKNESQSADMIQELQSDGFQIGQDDTVNATGETYFWAAFAGSHLSISSESNQSFHANDPPTAISTITITEDYLDPTITIANDIRIRIPAGFNMTWDTTDTTAVIGGGAAGKVSTTVGYEDGGQILVIDVTADFAASDQITISGLSFTNFSARSPSDNLELEVDNGDTVAAVDDKFIAIVAPTISSAANQYFIIGSSAQAISTITLTEDSYGPSVTAANDIRIRIPAGFNMTWDTTDTTATIGGSASGKVSATVSYEDGGQTLVIDATSDFAASDQITISDLSFSDFTAASLPDNLELEVKNDGLTAATDDKTIAIGDISISSAANQEFIVGDLTTAIEIITITEDSTTAIITDANDIRIRIPDTFYMTWDTTDNTAVIGGGAFSKVSTTVTYEDDGKTLVLDVTEDFAAGEQITISGLSFTNFTVASSGDRLELEVFNDGQTTAEDDRWKAIGGEPSAGSLLVYGEGSVITPRYRTWYGAPKLKFSGEASANDTNDVIKWVVLKPSPITHEMILATYSSADTKLYIQTWDGTNWTSNWNTTLNYDGSFRIFDIAYEKESGDAVVVFGHKDSKTLRYRKRVAGTWDSADTTISAVSPDDEVNWVRAESRPSSDDVFVATATKTTSLYALRWDGTANSWGDQIQTTAGLRNAGTEGFDIAFESASGDAFLIWGDGTANVNYRQFTTSWDASDNTAYTGLPDEVLWLAAAYDPLATSSKIAIAMVLENTTLEFGAWDGSGWVSRPAAIVAPNKDNRFIDVAFESDSGLAMYGFSQNTGGDEKKQFAWRTWTSAGGFGSVTVEDGLSDEVKFVQLKADPNSDDIMAVYADKAKDLYHRYWNGSASAVPSWTALAALADRLETELSDEDKNEAFMFAWKASPPTAVNLISFSAIGQDHAVRVDWQTGSETDNKGFHLYRAPAYEGPFERLTDKLIPGAGFMTAGRAYRFTDADVTRGELYYYRLEDIDIHGKRTRHGPVCVDWDGDGLPDDWELAFGLNPNLNDADLDPDADGLTNYQEYLRGTDPFNPDSDGDGILDGQEAWKREREEANGSQVVSRGVEVLASDEHGVTLELRTEAFEVTGVVAGDQEYERLRVGGYIHGFTHDIGRPELPVKGILLDVPPGRAARVSVLQTEVQAHSGYRIHPVPQHVAAEPENTGSLAERFVIDETFYRTDRFYPAVVAAAGGRYVFRDQAKHQIMFYPLAFNPATGDLTLYTRIRVRVDYVAAESAGDNDPQPIAWQAPAGSPRPPYKSALASINMALVGAPVITNPFASIVSSIQMLLGSLWTPPQALLPPPTPVYKIRLSETGIYKLTDTDLTTAGVDVTAMDLSRIRLYYLGQEVAIDVHDQNGNHTLDSADYILFYGRAVDAAYAKYTDANVYWLTLSGGDGLPKRMRSIDGTPAAGALATEFEAGLRHEADEIYGRIAPGADGIDRWFFSTYVPGDGWDEAWVPNAGDPIPFTVALPGAAGQGTVTLNLFSSFDLNHDIMVAVNGTGYGAYTWDGTAYYQLTIENVPLLDGDNTITLTCTSGEDTILLDWIEVVYPRDFAASGDSLTFAHDPAHRFEVTNLSGTQHFAFDITDAADVGRITGFTTSGSGPHELEFEPQTDADNARTYLILTDSALKRPTSITADAAGDLGDTANGADYILITHRNLGWDGNGDAHPWLTDLTALRQAQGHRVKVVDVEDIFDEFSYGLTTPAAIRDFLAYAYENWSAPAPQYVLLVGDHTYDYKNNDGGGAENFVPTWLAHTEHMGETVTDEYFARISGGDAVPDLYIGRLPAGDAAEAAVMVQKILDYEQAPNTKTWQKNTLLVADNQTEDYERVFEVIGDDAADLLPADMNAPAKAYLNDYVVARDLTVDIKNGFDDGSLIVNYSGHAGFNLWATERVFDNSKAWPDFYHDVDDLAVVSGQNKGMYPFVVNMSCLSGYFGGLGFWENPSLMEALLRAPNKGAAAAFMPTGETTTDGQHILNTALFEALFNDDIRQLGPAIATAKQTLLANGGDRYQQTSETFLLFGDPAMELKIPLPYRPEGLQGERKLSGQVVLAWQATTDCNGDPVTGYNVYRSDQPGQGYIKLNATAVTGTEYLDENPGNDDDIHYYAVTAVDADGDESPLSLELSPTPEPGSDGGGADDGTTTPTSTADETTDVGSGGGGGGACFVSTVATVEASFFISDRSASSLCGFLALIGLLWLGNRKTRSRRPKKNGLLSKIRRKWQTLFSLKSMYYPALTGARVTKEWFSAFRARFSEEKLELGDPGKLEELRLRIEERPDGIIEHPPLRQQSNRGHAPAEVE